MKDNILYVGSFELPDKNAAAQRVISNSKIFRDLGYNVTLVGLSKSIDSSQVFEYEGFKCVNWKYPHNPKEWYNYLFTTNDYVDYLRDFKPSLVVAYNHPAISLSKLNKWGKKNNCKVLSDCTEWFELRGNILFRTIKGWDTKKRMTQVHCELDGVIAISRFLQDYYLQRNCNVLLLPPLVDKKENKWNVNREKNDGTISLVYAGSSGEAARDNLPSIISALSEIRDSEHLRIKLFVIGLNEQQYKEKFNVQDEIDGNGFIKFMGRVPHATVLEVLANSDYSIFVRNSTVTVEAGFPTKFVEAISSGTLVLTNLSSNIKDYLREGENGFVLDFSSYESLKSSLLVPLKKDKADIVKIRESMNTDLFDYRSYISITKDFIQSL